MLGVGAVVGTVEGEIAEPGELRLDPDEPARVGGDVGEFDVVRGCALADALIELRAQVGREVVSTIAIRVCGECSERT